MRLFLLMCVLSTAALSAQSFYLSPNPAVNVPATNGAVMEIVEYNGMVYIAGLFTEVGGLPRQYLASFDAQTGAVSSWAPNPDREVLALAAHGGRISVGGAYYSIAGQIQHSIASFDVATGAITSWRPQLRIPAGIQNVVFDDDVHALLVAGETLYCGGGFLEVNGVPRGAACSFDLTDLGNNDGLTPWDPNLRGPLSGNFLLVGCEDLQVDLDSGFALLTGGMLEYGGDHQMDASPSGHAVRSAYFAVVSATGTGAPRWAPGQGPILLPYNITIIANYCGGAGRHAYMSGVFAGVTSAATFQPREYAMCIDLAADGLTTPVGTAFQPDPDERIRAFALDPQGQALVAGGYFSNIGGGSQRHLALLNPDTGALDAGWAPQLDAPVAALCAGQNRIWVGGGFTTVNGTGRANLAAFDYHYGAAHPPQVSVQTTLGPVPHNGRIDLATGWAVSDLDLAIAVSDADSDTVSVDVRFGGASAGLVAAEFERAGAATPLTITPASGAFAALDDVVTISLTVTDATGMVSSFSFVVEIVANGAPAPGSGPSVTPVNDDGGTGGGGGGCVADRGGYGTLAGLLFMFMAAMRLRRKQA